MLADDGLMAAARVAEAGCGPKAATADVGNDGPSVSTFAPACGQNRRLHHHHLRHHDDQHHHYRDRHDKPRLYHQNNRTT